MVKNMIDDMIVISKTKTQKGNSINLKFDWKHNYIPKSPKNPKNKKSKSKKI